MSALTSYLATLTSPKLWSDLTGDTTIVGSTFRTRFADVYTTRQALLNAIYAAAKAKADEAKDAADNAQDTANQGVSLATSMAVINGGFETMPLGYGWTADSGAGWITSNDSGTPGVAPNGAKRVAGSGGNTGAYRNNGIIGCQPGQVIAAQALIKTVGMTGTAYVFISWLNAALGEIGTTPGNQITGTTTAGSYAVGTNPNRTVYAHVSLGYSTMTDDTVYADNVVCTQRPSSVDEIPDGQTYTRAVQQSTSETVTNGNFQLPKNGDGSIPGWVAQDSTLNLSTAGPLIGTQSLNVVIAAGKLNAGVQSIKKYQCGAGDSFRVAANAYTNSGANPWVGLFYYDAAGGFVGNGYGR